MLKDCSWVTLLSGCLLLGSGASARVKITGVVTDSKSGEPLIGASVSGGQVRLQAVTDIDGHFILYNDTLVYPLALSVRCMGYRPRTIVVKSDEELGIQLEEDNVALGEIVVVGYGTQKRTSLTGAVATVRSEVFANTTSATLDGALSGQVAGLAVTSVSGQPGAASSVRIRGGNSVTASNEPLYVIDGFIYFKDASNTGTGLGAIESSLNPLSLVNPLDIESVEVLKDVSATAIYGSRGANGVIIVTTKKGRTDGGNARINYNFNVGFAHVTRTLDLMDASQWARYQKDCWGNKGGYTDSDIALLGKGTDWQKAALRTAFQQTHNLSVNGGSDKYRYAFSGSYTDQDGIIINSGLQRYNFHTNLDWQLRPGLRFGVNATYGRSRQEGLTITEEQVYNSSPYSAGITNSFVYALLMPPVVPVYNADGSYNFTNKYEYAYFAVGDHAANPIYDLRESVAENTNHYLLSNVWAQYQIGDFVLKATLGYNSEKLTQNYFSGAYTSLGLATEGIGGTGNRETDVWQQEYTVTYDRDINARHHLDALAGFTRQSPTSTFSSIRTNHFTNETLKHYNLGDGSGIYTPQTGISESQLNSIIGRVNYTLLDRYNATATFRADNSSRFAKNHRWGVFPSLGLSWNANRERFLHDVEAVDYLKVRASAGVVGNQEIPDYCFITSYSTGSYGGGSSYSKNSAANDNLKWETTASYNVGVDLGLLRGRLSLVLDLYYKKTSDLLLQVPVGFAQGVTTQMQNVGNVTNKGVELAIDGTLLERKDLRWTAGVNLAHNSNEITSMGTANNILLGSDKQQILRKGEALGSFYGLKFDGIVQKGEDVSLLPTVNGQRPKEGDVKFVDVNHDNRIDGSDRVILGSTQPKLTYGVTSSIGWKHWDASLVLAGSYGAKLYNALGRRLEQTGDSYNVLRTVGNSWTPDGGGNHLPLASTSRPFSYIDSRYVQNASYLKLRNLTIGYSLPLGEKFPLGIRLSATASNLFTITPYKGYDPEVSGGTDAGAYPSCRSVMFGVNVTL